MAISNASTKGKKRLIAGLYLVTSALIIAMFMVGCGETKPVKKTNYKALLNGTFVYDGAIPGGVSATITLILDRNNRSFQYKETGGISNRNYNGSFAVLGNQIVFTNTANKQTTKHTVTETNNGFKLKCVSNNNPISFGMQPLQGSSLEFFKQ